MHEELMPALVCPACHGELGWRAVQQDEDRIEAADARCGACGAEYPVREGIGVFLTPDLQRRDLWVEVESRLAQYLRQHPDVERQLMETPLEALAPADLFYRSQVLELRGEYAQARAVEKQANARLYTPAYQACYEAQLAYVARRLAQADGFIVDLASGRGALVERLAQETGRMVVATDFSPSVLRRNRQWFAQAGLGDQVSLLAFDARRTPFRDGGLAHLTTNLGLANIEQPGDLLGELRRVVSGTFWAITHFFPEEDDANAQAIEELGLAPLLFQEPCLEQFRAAGWEVDVPSQCASRALPTPTGVILEGAGVDGLPVAETVLTWCVLEAR